MNEDIDGFGDVGLEDFENFLSGVVYELMGRYMKQPPDQEYRERLFTKYNDLVLEFFLSSHQREYHICQLPKNEGHRFTVGYQCVSDENHKFCRSHILSRCPICGFSLRKIKGRRI